MRWYVWLTGRNKQRRRPTCQWNMRLARNWQFLERWIPGYRTKREQAYPDPTHAPIRNRSTWFGVTLNFDTICSPAVKQKYFETVVECSWKRRRIFQKTKNTGISFVLNNWILWGPSERYSSSACSWPRRRSGAWREYNHAPWEWSHRPQPARTTHHQKYCFNWTN